MVGASKGENLILTCNVITDPEAGKFFWKFENSEETIEIDANRYAFNGSKSTLHYTPVTEQDYGVISCWSSNEIGVQTEPCLFQLIQAGLPSPAQNCTLKNQTQQSMSVDCLLGYDGGMPQTFILEVISTNDQSIKLNITNLDEPKFVINYFKFLFNESNTSSDVLKMYIYSVNQKGRSDGILIKEFYVGNQNNTNKSMSSSSPIFIGIILTLLLLGLVILIRMYINTKPVKRNYQEEEKYSKESTCALLNQDKLKVTKKFSPKWQAIERNSKVIDFEFLDDDRGEPDVISVSFKNYLIVF